MVDVVVLVDDLFFQAKIVETARLTGVTLAICGTGDAFVAAIERESPKLAIADLNSRRRRARRSLNACVRQATRRRSSAISPMCRRN